MLEFFMLRIFSVFVKIYNRFEVENIKHLSALDSCIIASNHASYLDSLYIHIAMPIKLSKKVYFLIAKEFFENRIRNLVSKLSHSRFLPIERFGNVETGLQESTDALKDKKILVAFPEGARTRTGRFMPFSKGVAYLAYNTQLPIVPIYIDGSYDVLKARSYFPRPNKVKLVIGKPIYMKAYQEKENEKSLSELFNDITTDLKDAILDLKRDLIFK